MKNFFKNIFVWWNQKTIGTMLYTYFNGKFKGEDKFGNKYYESKSGKRWVIYKKETEATSISGDWYSWIHFMINKFPENNDENKYPWEKDRQTNQTGTDNAYRPKKISKGEKLNKKYDIWKI